MFLLATEKQQRVNFSIRETTSERKELGFWGDRIETSPVTLIFVIKPTKEQSNAI